MNNLVPSEIEISHISHSTIVYKDINLYKTISIYPARIDIGFKPFANW